MNLIDLAPKYPDLHWAPAGLADLADYPFLAKAKFGQAYSSKVEWVVEKEGGDAGGVIHRVDSNYTQIFRRPVEMNGKPGDVLLEILADVEAALESDRKPELIITSNPVGIMGGVRHYVPRGKPFDLTLRILRPLELIRYDRGLDWLVELSAQVVERP